MSPASVPPGPSRPRAAASPTGCTPATRPRYCSPAAPQGDQPGGLWPGAAFPAWRRTAGQCPGTPCQPASLAAVGPAPRPGPARVAAGRARGDRPGAGPPYHRRAYPPAGDQPVVQRSRHLATGGGVDPAGPRARVPGPWSTAPRAASTDATTCRAWAATSTHSPATSSTAPTASACSGVAHRPWSNWRTGSSAARWYATPASTKPASMPLRSASRRAPRRFPRRSA